jgi:glycerol uptake facilitator protein
MSETPRTVRATTAAPSLARRCVAEAVGTGILVAFGAGAIMAALIAGEGEITYGGVGFIALAHALAIALAIYGIGGISGGHINPAVTFGLAIVRRIPWPEVPAYWLAQLVGGAIGGLAVLLAVGAGAVDLGGVGSPAVADGVRFGQAGVAEALGAFLLVFTIMAVAVDPRAPKGFAGLLIGLAIGVGILAFGPVSGGAFNPARAFGSYAANLMAGGTVAWNDFLLYWIGPLLGGAIGALTYDLVAQPQRLDREPTVTPETPGAGGDVRGR